MKTITPAIEHRQKRLAAFLPLFIVPFITLIFWTLGGGRIDKNKTEEDTKSKVNMEIPDANFEKKQPSDKMSFYAQALLDSAKKKELSQNDPYINQPGSPQSTSLGAFYNTPAIGAYGGGNYTDPNEAKIYGKLNELNSVLNQPTPPVVPAYGAMDTKSFGQSNLDLERLQGMMNMMQEGQQTSGDPEMQQINGLLEKILDIQHPDRAQEKLNTIQAKNRGQVYAVSANVEENPISIIEKTEGAKKRQSNGFYGLNETRDVAENNSITAVVHDNQTIVSGSIVKLRLVTDIMIGNELIPKDNFLFGQATISGERLKIEINSIRYNNSIYPVKLTVYDLDGMDGVHIPGAISRDVAKESGTDVMQGLGINSFDPNLATQAASAGIELSKNLIKRKVKLVKVTLKSGYRLLLKDNKQEYSN